MGHSGRSKVLPPFEDGALGSVCSAGGAWGEPHLRRVSAASVLSSGFPPLPNSTGGSLPLPGAGFLRSDLQPCGGPAPAPHHWPVRHPPSWLLLGFGVLVVSVQWAWCWGCRRRVELLAGRGRQRASACLSCSLGSFLGPPRRHLGAPDDCLGSQGQQRKPSDSLGRLPTHCRHAGSEWPPGGGWTGAASAAPSPPQGCPTTGAARAFWQRPFARAAWVCADQAENVNGLADATGPGLGLACRLHSTAWEL